VIEEIARLVVVACVEVERTITKFVIVEEAEFTKTPSPAARGERNAPPSVQLEAPSLVIHVPLTAQQPAVKFTPLANEEVAALDEKSALAMVVEALVMEKRVVVA
jgi:hypothetical protein